MKLFAKLSVCILWAGAYIVLLSLQPHAPFTLLAGLPVCFWLSGLLHELGHLAAYAALKLPRKRFCFSLFVWEADTGSRLDGSRPIFSGSCSCAYDKAVPLWRYRLALLSGGITTLVVGSVIVIALLCLHSAQAGFLYLFGPVCILGGLFNLLPFSADRSLLRQIQQESE